MDNYTAEAWARPVDASLTVKNAERFVLDQQMKEFFGLGGAITYAEKTRAVERKPAMQSEVKAKREASVRRAYGETGITTKQRAILDAIISIVDVGEVPTKKSVKDKTGLSYNLVGERLEALEFKKFIKISGRTIELLRRPS